ncbi:PQQ-dependent sugar dehydrogenase [Pseudokineococcus lusitanus]|uniref:Glucose/arabinose dehydrogenase n=1 Tax=Pseudokineococcus lusitanus TaxID=763993 RepID=A0A3N1HQJ8_9ACTN|nr:PQQ-dependent sugar dehydrogenase [Pseudokineococcus lusitanus]ROP44706.1 glucose/arabinose dehydrogenase [Pseudokineococcus lusitanus]
MTKKSSRVALGATLGALALPAALLVGLPAAAHPGHDHGQPAAAADDALDWGNYERVLLTKDTGEPIDLAVLPDGEVLHTARNGDVRLTDPDAGTTDVIARFDVYANSEDGMQTIGLAPDFEESGWVYVYYAPREMEGTATNGLPYPSTTAAGSAPTTLPPGADDATYWQQWLGYNQLSRVKYDAEARTFDMATEQVIIKVEVQRGQCCHVGGDFDFDADGDVYLATGDNTPAGTPGANGYAPNNDAPGMNPGLDARRGAGSTNDLRGKVLQLRVAEDGSYTTPDDNLFAPGTESTRPEIFYMGVRNPFRMDVDAETGSVSWGDYGPDAGAADPARGPMGLVEWVTTGVDQPGNSGWPYCTGDQSAYNDWDFATATPRDWFDCDAGPTNTSRWNTGLDQVPPATPATLWYGDDTDDQPWPELTDFGPGGQGPMGGPVYHYDAENPSQTKFPEHWDQKSFFAEFSQDYVAAFTVDWPAGPVTQIENFLPNDALLDAAQPVWDNPMDIEFGPDGSLYVLDYGDGFFRQNPDAGLYRVDWAPGNKTPQASFTATPVSGSDAPLEVTFDGSASVDPEGSALTYGWDFDGDGTVDAEGPTATHTYTERGLFTAVLRVTDASGKVGVTSRRISVGNVAPTVTIQDPPDGGFFSWGDSVPFRITTDDPEDGTATDCTKVSWTFGLGHAEHAHPEILGTGCQGAWATPADAPEHGDTEKLYGVVVVTYTDRGADGLAGATGEASLTLNPKTQEAEHHDATQGVEVVEDASASGRAYVSGFEPGDWIANDPVNLTGVEEVVARTRGGAGALELRWGAADAEPFMTVPVAAAEAWTDTTVALADAPTGSGVLYVTSTGGFDVDSMTFEGPGVADVAAPVVTATTTPTAPSGQGGWWTGPVTVQLAATDNGTLSRVERSLDGGATWTNVLSRGVVAPFQVTAQGVTQVQYRAVDAGGNVSAVGTLEVKIDSEAPVVSTGVEDGATFGDSDVLVPGGDVTDATSGVATTTATLGGVEVPVGEELELWRFPLGEHEYVVTATDVAGNTATASSTITLETSTDDLVALVSRFEDDGLLSRRGANQLQTRLAVLVRHEDAGRTAQAVRAAEAFKAAASNRAWVADPELRALFQRDADALVAGWTAR